MSLQPEEFLAQDPSAFLNQPSFLEQGLQAPAPTPVADHPDLAKIAIGIAAALIVLRLLMKTEFAKKDVRTPEEINESAKKIYKRILPAWLQVSVPVITQAYQLGSTAGGVSYEELEAMATQYAAELGEYVNDTSILALTEGFNSQVNAGWSERLAWVRAREAYGLDAQQMRSYVKGLMVRDKTDYVTDPIPPASRSAIDRAFLYRADRIGQNESYKATQVGRNLVWLSMQASGQIPEGTQKRWITADDERVCAVCGPLDQVTIPLHRRFESAGRFFYAPGVHPNCRCTIELVYPDLGYDVVKAASGDPYNRNPDGEFATNESRRARGLIGQNKGLIGQNQALVGQSRALVEGLVSEESLIGQKGALEQIKQADQSALAGLIGYTHGNQGSALEAVKEGREKAAAEAQAALAAKEEKPLVSAKVKVLKPVATVKEEKKAKTVTEAKAKTVVRAKAKEVRTPKPSDPQQHDGVFFVPAGRFMRAFRLKDKDLTPGTPITIGALHPESGVHGLTGYHQRGRNAEPAISPAFELAFDQYMSETGLDLRERKRIAENKRQGQGRSEFKGFGDNEDLKEFKEQRKILTGLSVDDLKKVISRMMDDPDGLEAVKGTKLMDTEWMDEADANSLANEVMWALKSEADLFDDHYAKHNTWRGLPWREEVNSIKDAAADEDRVDDMEDPGNVPYWATSGGGSATGMTRPVFFRIPDWYGVDPEEPDLGASVRRGFAEGQYVVERTDVMNIPSSVVSSEAEDIMDKIVVVTLKLDKAPEG